MESSPRDVGEQQTPTQHPSLETATSHIKFIGRFNSHELLYTALYYGKAIKKQHPHSNIATEPLEQGNNIPNKSNDSAASAHFQARLEFLGKSVIRSAAALIFYTLLQSGMDPWEATGLDMGLDWLSAIKNKTETEKYKEHTERGVALVCSKSMIARYAKELGLETCLEQIVGGYGAMGTREKQQMLAKYLSSVMGALYLDKMNLVVIMDVLKVPMLTNKLMMDPKDQEHAKTERSNGPGDNATNSRHARSPAGDDKDTSRQHPYDLGHKGHKLLDNHSPAEITGKHDEPGMLSLAPPTKKPKLVTGGNQAVSGTLGTATLLDSAGQQQGPDEGINPNSKHDLFIFCARNGIPQPKLEVHHVEGPQHAPIFKAILIINGHHIGAASGPSKKDAQTAICTIAMAKPEAERMAWKRPPSIAIPQ